MMTLIGFLVFLGGLVVAGMVFMGTAPAAIASLPIPFWGWICVSAVGAFIIMLNRRPGN